MAYRTDIDKPQRRWLKWTGVAALMVFFAYGSAFVRILFLDFPGASASSPKATPPVLEVPPVFDAGPKPDGGSLDAGPAPIPLPVRVALHVHTSVSDGRGTVRDIAEAARATKTDVVWLTDHDVTEGDDRVENGVLFLHGAEQTTKFGHLLVFGADRLLTKAERYSDPLSAARSVHGLAGPAHGDRTSYVGWANSGQFDALEIYNLATDAIRAASFPWTGIAWAALAYPANALYALSSIMESPDELLRRWDGASVDRDVVGFCGTDAHGIPSYAVALGAVTNYFFVDAPLTGDVSKDRDQLRAALRAGRLICALEVFGDARGVTVFAVGGTGRVEVGGTAHRPATLHVRGGGANVAGTILRDGEVVHRFDGDTAYRALDKGRYRVELSRRVPTFWGSRVAPWVFANPITVR
ncbi:MAG: PHP domain-containing protein [Deltaproteobacteria bacterium]|nr:PHP domain-containing protein [Deltaproteobacteria bacterium]